MLMYIYMYVHIRHYVRNMMCLESLHGKWADTTSWNLDIFGKQAKLARHY